MASSATTTKTDVVDTVKRIRFVVTGDLERKAIAASISALFPRTASDGNPVVWLRAQKVPAATTHRLTTSVPPSGTMKALARRVIAEAAEGEDGSPADLVIAVDDLELHNFDQPEVVCDHFQRAMELEIEDRKLSQAAERRLRTHIRDRCSFHLLCPMVEAYFFGEPEALTRAGCAPGVEPLLVKEDVEDFECRDPVWLPNCTAENRRKAQPPNPMPWWREERHPKHYLEHLVARNGGFYDEVLGGNEALKALDWHRVPSDGQSVMFARALFEDVADFFGVSNPLGQGEPASFTYPARKVNRSKLLLRNL
jgi:hypothetical protein